MFECLRSPDSSVGIAAGYAPDGEGIGVRFPAGATGFALLYNFQTGSGAHAVSYPEGTGCSFPGCIAARA
jgi:hypothetical protein